MFLRKKNITYKIKFRKDILNMREGKKINFAFTQK